MEEFLLPEALHGTSLAFCLTKTGTICQQLSFPAVQDRAQCKRNRVPGVFQRKISRFGDLRNLVVGLS